VSDGSGAPTGPKRRPKSRLLLQVRKSSVIEQAWSAIQRNARTSKSLDTRNEVAAFEEQLSVNLRRLRRLLQQKKFIFPPARGVRIPKGEKKASNFRPLVVAKVESRIVQRAIHDVLITVPAIQTFVHTPNSFGGIRKLTHELSAVPAAIKAVLDAIGRGHLFFVRSDIAKFFTRIPKSVVTDVVKKAIEDDEFMELFTQAITVELENMAQLREHANAFPIEDIGVAQGNSLSPLLGNIFLYDFDLKINRLSGIRCIRYIDDFIVLGANQIATESAFATAQEMLKHLGMNVSSDKTQRGSVKDKFEFLGIEFANGLLRPCRKARERMLSSIESIFCGSTNAFRAHRKTNELDGKLSLLESLRKVGGVMQGWGKHYRFCNDGDCLRSLDQHISIQLKKYLSTYREERERTNDEGRWRLLGIEALSRIEREPFCWPTRADC
jgi:RNA-directed DNA polymerase